MLAITVRTPGEADALTLDHVPVPAVGIEQVLVRNRFVGVNHGDVIRRRRGSVDGASAFVPGFEGVGEVVGVGASVASFALGESVAYLVLSGAYAEYTVVPVVQAMRLPREVPAPLAAGCICTGLTAWHLLELTAARVGTTILVHGAGGGAGSAVLQLARTRGLCTIAVVSSADKAEYAGKCGANEVIHGPDWAEAVLRATGGRGVDVILDCVGQAVTEGNARCIRKGGRWFYYGSAAGHATFPGSAVLSKALHVRGFVIFDAIEDETMWAAGMHALRDALATGVIAPRVEICPVATVRDVHLRLENRTVIGKCVLDCREWNRDLV